jgi:hypothetical protein
VTPSVRGFRARLVALSPDSRGVGSIVNELLLLTPAERGEPGRVPDLSVRLLACTGSGDGAPNFGPLGPMASGVTQMGSFSTNLRRRFQRIVSPHIYLGSCASQRLWGRSRALTLAFALGDC